MEILPLHLAQVAFVLSVLALIVALWALAAARRDRTFEEGVELRRRLQPRVRVGGDPQ